MSAHTENLREMIDANGWRVGTQLRRTTLGGDTMDFEITALGEKAVMVKHISEQVNGELLLYSAAGDTFIELVSRERIVAEVISLSERMTYLLRQLSEKEVQLSE